MRATLVLCLLLCGCLSDPNTVEEIQIVTPSTAASTQPKRIYLYWYSAPWCGPCKQDEPLVREWAENRRLKISDVPDGNCEVNRINVDEVVSIRKIESIPTYLIVNEDGVELWRHEGRIDLPALDLQWDSLK